MAAGPLNLHIKSFMLHLRAEKKSDRTVTMYREYSSSYVNNQYRCLQQFFKWLADEEEIGDPMRKVAPSKVVAKPVPVFEDGEVERILKMPPTKHDRGAAKRGDACKLRDAAIIQILRDTGMRLAELAGLKVDDVSLEKRRAFVTGKGDKSRYVKFTHSAAKALDRYLRQRAKHPDAHLPFLWLSQKGKGPGLF